MRDHVEELIATGASLNGIARSASVAVNTLRLLLYGSRRDDGSRRPPSRRVQAATAKRILAVSWPDVARNQIDGTGTRRRIQALVALGWTQSLLAAELGRSRDVLRLAESASVSRQIAVLVDDMYDRLSMTLPGPAARPSDIGRARQYARRRGWLPPLAWDDDTIDDPAAEASIDILDDIAEEPIDEIAVVRRMAGDRAVELTRTESAELVRRCLAQRWTQSRILQVTGIRPRAHHLPGLAA